MDYKNDERYWNIKLLNKWFAISSILFLISIAWMFLDDNDDEFKNKELILMDFGVRWMTMHADISRTVPASGKFNPMQKLLYEIVLKGQREV